MTEQLLNIENEESTLETPRQKTMAEAMLAADRLNVPTPTNQMLILQLIEIDNFINQLLLQGQQYVAWRAPNPEREPFQDSPSIPASLHFEKIRNETNFAGPTDLQPIALHPRSPPAASPR